MKNIIGGVMKGVILGMLLIMTMTPIKGGKDGFRRIIIDYSSEKDTYCFGFINDKENIFPHYVNMFLELQDKLQEKFGYKTL